MFFRQVVLESLGHASYLIGSEATGEALVFDPRRDVSCYFDIARSQGLHLRYAVDSHGHNDYLSGLSELSARSDVEILGAAEGSLGYAHRPVRDGDFIQMGEIGIEVLHTPGHTPEHLSLLLREGDAQSEPAILLSGGALLVGDLARPDLLGGPDDAEIAAKIFCRTIQKKILTLPDHVEVFPTHVAGSLCGGNIGSRLSTTVGYERRTNEILARVSARTEFVTDCLRMDNLPAIPPYWRRMRTQNLAGVASLGVLGEPPALGTDAFARLRDEGAIVVDTRTPEAFGGAHIPGSLNVGLGASFPTWAGTVLPPDVPLLVVIDRASDLWDVTWHLLRIGYDSPSGWLAGGIRTWRMAARDLASLPQVSVAELRVLLAAGEVDLLDVRQPPEWSAGHVAEATFITGAELTQKAAGLPDDRPLAVMCGSGFRSSIAASVLLSQGRRSVLNVSGGMAAWRAAGYPIDQ